MANGRRVRLRGLVAIRLCSIIAPSGAAPLRPQVGPGFDWTDLILASCCRSVLAEGLRRGRRLACHHGHYGHRVPRLLGVVTVIAATTGTTDTRYDIDSLGASIADALLWLTQLVLVAGRSARPRGAISDVGDSGHRDTERRAALLASGGRLSWMTTWDANEWYVEPDRPGYVAYQTHAGVAVGLCDPIAIDAAGRRAMGLAFIDHVQGRGLLPCLFSVTGEVCEWVRLDGWRTVEVAVEAVIDLPDLQFKGKAWQDVRSALNRASKEGVTFELGALHDMPASRIAQVRTISEQWVGDKGLPEMGFTLGGVDEALDPAVRVGLAVDGHGTVHGVTSWLPIYGPGATIRGWTLDVMRRLPDGFRPVMEFLIASSCVAFREEGALLVSLSGARWPATRPLTRTRVRSMRCLARRATGTAVRLSIARPVQVEVLPAPRSAVPRLSGRGRSAAHRARPYPRLLARRKLRRPGRRWLAFPDNRSQLTTDAAFKRTAHCPGYKDGTRVKSMRQGLEPAWLDRYSLSGRSASVAGMRRTRFVAASGSIPNRSRARSRTVAMRLDGAACNVWVPSP